MRDVSRLPLNELAKKRELLLVGHDIWGAANLSLCDEHFQMGHDLVFELLAWPDMGESDHADDSGRVKEEDSWVNCRKGWIGTNLKPLVELDMILVRLSIIVLASSGLSPKTFCELEGTGDRVVEDAIVFARLAGERDGEHAGLNAQLEDTTAVRARGREGAF